MYEYFNLYNPTHLTHECNIITLTTCVGACVGEKHVVVDQIVHHDHIQGDFTLKDQIDHRTY